jgi:hypothetical protein
MSPLNWDGSEACECRTRHLLFLSKMFRSSVVNTFELLGYDVRTSKLLGVLAGGDYSVKSLALSRSKTFHGTMWYPHAFSCILDLRVYSKKQRVSE